MDPDVSKTPQSLTIAVDGLRLAALLWLPKDEPVGGLLLCHGAGSCKENHAPMAEQAAARGLAALAFDFRGHGQSDGAMDGGGAHDVIAAAAALRRAAGVRWVAARGSSMGGFWLLLAAAGHRRLFRSLVALCPADSDSLARGLDELRRLETIGDPDAGQFGRFDQDDLRRVLATTALADVCTGLPRVLLVHARDDGTVPFASSVRLAKVLADPVRFMVLPRGGHHAAQRSPRVARATLDWVMSYA
jgi:pimeloyl-ACP methyl ester carboxylesterase